jgi:calcium binding protein 39
MQRPLADQQARKDVGTIYGALLRRQISDRQPTVEHLSSKPEIVFAALKGYDRLSTILELVSTDSVRYKDPEVALNSGAVLKEMLKYEPLARILLYSEE